jgi:16S rRNA (guanine(966)-N(2))-methyltransferase RsmD
MRVIAGTLKGRRLDAPDWPGLRPTSDKLRETLFNVVAPRIAGARVLDGYAGTGAVGIEALSRGAAHVTFVDRDARAVALIRANLEKCGLAAPGRREEASERYAIIRAGFGEMAARRPALRFDLVFLDPPYGAAELTAAVAASESLVGDDTLLVVEHAKRDPAPLVAGSLERTRELTSGDSALAFYRRRATTSWVVETA